MDFNCSCTTISGASVTNSSITFIDVTVSFNKSTTNRDTPTLADAMNPRDLKYTLADAMNPRDLKYTLADAMNPRDLKYTIGRNLINHGL